MTTITATSSPATQICTWNSLFPYSFSPEADVHDVVCDYADDYDVEAVVADYVAAIDAALEGAGVTLCGELFFGPADHAEDIDGAIREAVESVDLMAVAERHDVVAG